MEGWILINRLCLPITLKGKPIRNRIVLPPMVLFGKSTNAGYVTEKHIEHYKARARGGAGLIIVEATSVQLNGRLSNDQLGIWSDEHIGGLRSIVEACHAHGAKVMLQIHHAGTKTPQGVCKSPLSTSSNISEMQTIKDDFVKGALRAYKAGFDGIELHGAHGYLLNQFASSETNNRIDEYGGDLKGRMKMSLDIIRDIKSELDHNDFILGYRMGGNEPTLKDGIQIAKLLEDAGVDLLHVSAGIGSPGIPHPDTPSGFPFNWIVYCGIEVKRNVSIPVIVVNGIRTRDQASMIIENRLADFVAVGQSQLVDPSWANKTIQKLDVVKCLECKPRCRWFESGDLCPHNILSNK